MGKIVKISAILFMFWSYIFQAADVRQANEMLFEAAINNDLAMAREALNQGACVNAVKGFKLQTTPLIEAVDNHASEVVAFLLEQKADPNIAGDEGWKPLHYAVNKGFADIVEKLLDAGADINGVNDNNWTSLHFIAYQPKLSNMIKMFINRGANKEIKDFRGNTPLYDAIFNNNIDLVNQLLEAGADPNVKNNQSSTPVEYAVSRKNIDALKKLIRHGAIIPDRLKTDPLIKQVKKEAMEEQ